MKEITLPYENPHEGIRVMYIQRRKTLRINGFYDMCVGIESTEITLKDFFQRLNITLKDCQGAFKDDSYERPKQERRVGNEQEFRIYDCRSETGGDEQETVPAQRCG